MSCNTLNNTQQDLLDRGLLGEKNSIEESNYTEVEALLNTWQAYAERKYGLTEKLFTLKQKSVPDSTATGRVTVYSLKFEKPAFEKLDILVEDYKVEQSRKESEIEQEAGKLNALNRLNNQGGQFISEYGETFDTVEDISDDMISGPVSNSQVIIQPTYEDYVKHKRNLLKNIEKTISKLYNEKRLHNNAQITSKISRFNKIKEGLEQDIEAFETTNDKLALIIDYLQKDFDLINNLISKPTLENIFLAKDLLKYIKDVADVKASEYRNNGLFTPKANTTYSPEVLNVIRGLGAEISLQEAAVESAVDKVFLELLEKNRENLEMLYPGKSMEDIKDLILQPGKDINFMENLFMGQGENLWTTNNLLDDLLRWEYEKEKHIRSGEAQKVIQKIDAALINAEKELERLGKKITAKLGKVVYSGYDYRFLYQTDESGNKRSNLIGKFSRNWEKTIKNLNISHIKNISLARANKDWALVEKLLIDRYNDLNDKTEFVNFNLLHDIYDNHTGYGEFKTGSDTEAANYKAELINKIGEEEYENLVQSQINMLDGFIEERKEIIKSKLRAEGVADVSSLSDNAKLNLDISLRRLNPLEFLNSYNRGTKGMIEFTIGTQSNEKPAYLKYNSVIPRSSNLLGINTNFYDQNFTEIENNPALKALWKAMREGAQLMGENLVDSNLRLSSNSLLSMKKSFVEESINKDSKTLAKEGISNMTNVKTFFKNLLSAKMPNYEGDRDTVILSTQLNSFENEVNSDFAILKTEIANIIGQQLTDKLKVSFSMLPSYQQEALLNVLGVNTQSDLLVKLNGRDVFKINDLKIFSEQKVMEQQTMNLPLAMKAYLELSAEHKARTVSKNEVNIYREKSLSIKTKDSTASQEAGGIREKEAQRQKFFYDKVILNRNQKDHSGKILSRFLRNNNRVGFDIKGVGQHFLKNFTPEEKIIYNSAVKRLDTIEQELSTATPEEADSLNQEREMLETRLRILGKDYLISAIWDNVINKLPIKVGLGFNILSNIKNRIQGLTSLLSRDGELWSQGNIYPVNHFMGLNKTRYVRQDYNQEWEKMELFIKQLNVLQDGTNELQRAESKLKQNTKWLNPMYGTEVVEFYNQSSGILAMAMDLEIPHATEVYTEDRTFKTSNGETRTEVKGQPVMYALFDGSRFTAYKENNNGILELKPEFNTPENVERFEKMSSPDMITWKTSVDAMIRNLNGDYSSTGVTRIKGSIYSKGLMLFKTWLPKYLSVRYRYKQKNVRTGQIENGYLISTLLNDKTNFTGAVMLGATGIIGVLSIAPLMVTGVAAGAIAIGGVAAHAWNSYKNKTQPNVDPTEPIAILEQCYFIMKSLNPTYHLWETPINLLAGKEIITPAKFSDSANLTPQEIRDVRLLMKNMQNTAILMLLKIGIQAFFQDNEDDEPKGTPGSEQNKKYIAQIERRENWKATYNLLENIMTGIYQETSLATEPTSVISTLGSKNGLESSLDKIIKLSSNLARYGHGEDVISKGNRAGQSKLGNTFRKFVLPSLFRDIRTSTFTDFTSKSNTWRGGFETSMEREWITNEAIDGMFTTQYKKDKAEKLQGRQEKQREFIEDYEEENNVNFNDLSVEKQESVVKKAKKAAKKESANPDREDYDEEQELKEE